MKNEHKIEELKPVRVRAGIRARSSLPSRPAAEPRMVDTDKLQMADRKRDRARLHDRTLSQSRHCASNEMGPQ